MSLQLRALAGMFSSVTYTVEKDGVVAYEERRKEEELMMMMGR